MLKRKRAVVIIFITALVLAFTGSQHASAQKTQPEPISSSDLLKMLANQPDHIADRTVVLNDIAVKIKVAKKQDRMRQEFCPLDQAPSLKDESYRRYKIITISKLNQPTIALDPQEKTYAEAPQAFASVAFDLEAFLRNMASETAKLKAEIVGTETIEGIETNKIRLTFEGETEEMYLYLARDSRKNLFLKMDSGSVKQLRGSYTASNISFVVPDELFEIPKDYRRVTFDSMVASLRQKALR